jgi:hypothetical protein
LDAKYTPGKTKGEKMVEDFEYFAENYFNQPEYLRIDGKPAFIIYNASAYRNISKYFDRIKENLKKRGITLFLIADVVCWSGLKVSKKNLAFFWNNPPKELFKIVFRAIRRMSPKSYEKDFSLSKYFSAITGYNLYHIQRLENLIPNIDNLFQRFSKYAKDQNLNFIPNVMPGYDDRSQNGLERPIIERNDGKLYEDYWRVAKKNIDPKLQMIMLTTFNEWHEGTEIEASKEYGNQYVELTKSLKNN